MSIGKDWSQDGGLFLPEDGDGYYLEQELDLLAGYKKMAQGMHENYPDCRADIVPEKVSLLRCISTAGFIGLLSTGISVVVYEAGYGFIDIWKKLH